MLQPSVMNAYFTWYYVLFMFSRAHGVWDLFLPHFQKGRAEGFEGGR